MPDYVMLYEAIRTGTNLLLSLTTTLKEIVLSSWFWAALVALIAYKRPYYEAIFAVILALMIGVITENELPLVLGLSLLGLFLRIGITHEQEIIRPRFGRVNWYTVAEILRGRRR